MTVPCFQGCLYFGTTHGFHGFMTNLVQLLVNSLKFFLKTTGKESFIFSIKGALLTTSISEVNGNKVPKFVFINSVSIIFINLCT